MPVWNEPNKIIEEDTRIVFTDKSINMLLCTLVMRYPYDKIVNLGYDEKWNYAYFDIKTASPYAHRFTVRSFAKRDRQKAQSVCLLLKCLIGY